MKRTARGQATEPGFDSFLDIVANLVGILVILIMVIGVRTQEAWDASASETAAPPELAQLPDVQTPKAQLVSLQTEAADMARRLDQVRAQIAQRQRGQDALARQLSGHREESDKQRAQFQADQRQKDKLNRQLAVAYGDLAELEQKQRDAKQQAAKPTVIQHHPTPLARTVFGREEHFRLDSGRLAHVPLNELTNQLKREARLKVWKLENASRTTETIGPMDGFCLKYTLLRRDQLVRTSAGTARRSVVELDRFVLVPMSDDLGQPVEAALEPGSPFRQRLKSLDPSETTITVWTYPDSYPEFRQLKQHLHQLGYPRPPDRFRMAIRSADRPGGSKSSAQ